MFSLISLSIVFVSDLVRQTGVLIVAHVLQVVLANKTEGREREILMKTEEREVVDLIRGDKERLHYEIKRC